MSPSRPMNKLNRHYKQNPGFRKWVQANEAFFAENPEVFQELSQDPTMVNLFMDVLILNAATLQRKFSKN